ncbi:MULTISPECIES: alpha/beta hydrolase [Arthrobacter]|uniref:Pimeloyl-ACP methyl ester carboxylesterase n=1 Tax=Arthrobacter bambusae TaxID=1338426 RepID=A0AAW8DHK4_9MICC|nr:MULTISPECIES: alpha/beta hydrolase [Arthrobacter]MDP9907265.1 pimeloyl-ACP methyl ester carboxylesterase [Arthrobacter bambusae]MDQ0131401.1 pimeloyl-ACP methyl ester carboxylesterase [Arthrobacter bambusae]MDQ0182735.1 pimeloyl-ACP methyl ester carboxylesterase [Arthrobacter bambusae]
MYSFAEDINLAHHKAWISSEDNVRIHYVTAGHGDKTILLIHGAPQTWYAWRRMIRPLIQAGYRLVIPDYRGAGGSSKPAGGYEKWTMAEDLHKLLHEHLHVNGPVAVVGHDIGSMVASAYALRYREDVRTLTTMEAPLPGTSYFDERKNAKSAWHFDFHAATDIAVHLTHGREKWYINRFFQDLCYDPDAISPEDLEHYARSFEAPGAMRALFEAYGAFERDVEIHRADIAENGKISTPVLATGGAEQSLARNYAPMMEEISHDVRGELVPRAGHWVPEENPEYLARLIVGFDSEHM